MTEEDRGLLAALVAEVRPAACQAAAGTVDIKGGKMGLICWPERNLGPQDVLQMISNAGQASTLQQSCVLALRCERERGAESQTLREGGKSLGEAPFCHVVPTHSLELFQLVTDVQEAEGLLTLAHQREFAKKRDL